MTRQLAGVFGRAAEGARSAACSTLGPDASGLTTEGFTVAWTGEPFTTQRPTVALSGALWNCSQLARDLGATGVVSPEQVLERAFERWGEAALTRLRGSFVVVTWDSEARAGLLATDHLGVGGLFFRQSEGRLMFGTELRILLSLPSNRPAPAESSVVQWLADGYLEPGETLWDGVRRLRGGQLVRLDGEGWETASYWSPRYREPEHVSVTEATDRLQVAFADAVRRRMDQTGTTGVLLSGGLDSSAIAAVAHGLDPPVGSLKAYTHVYPTYPELDESHLARLTTGALEIPWEPLPVALVGTLRRALEFQVAWEVPAATPMFAFTQPLLERAAQDGISVMLDGEGGDELFGCSSYLIADRLRGGNFRGALALARRLPETDLTPSRRELLALVLELGVKGAAPHAFHRSVRRVIGPRRYAARWLTARSARLYVESRDDWAWKRNPGPRWWAFLADLITSWREQMGAHDFFRQRDSLAGIATRHPLLDDVDLIELVLRLPPQLSFDPELTRPLERAVVAGALPDEIRLRQDKSIFNRLAVDALSGPDRALAASLLQSADAELWAFVKPEPVRALLQVPAERRGIEWARLVWRLVTTESWLRAQADQDFPARLLERLGDPLTDAPPCRRAPRRARTS